MTTSITVRAGGRINIIGEHTDYTGGLALPMAIHLATTVSVERGGDVVRLRSDHDSSEASVRLDVADPGAASPAWARYVAAVVAELHPATGAVGTVTSDLPIGAGLSSSAALEIAVATALGFVGSATQLAQLCQRAEHAAVGVPCGILDQLAIATGVEGTMSRIDCADLTASPVSLPEELVIVAVHSGQHRTLAGSGYAERRAQCEAAQQIVGPLRRATIDDLAAIDDPVVRRRAHHVITENARVDAFIAALSATDYAAAGGLLDASHRSLRNDFEVSTPVVDALVARLTKLDRVHGARMTGGGFGGVVIALCDQDVDLPDDLEAWRLRPCDGVSVVA